MSEKPVNFGLLEKSSLEKHDLPYNQWEVWAHGMLEAQCQQDKLPEVYRQQNSRIIKEDLNNQKELLEKQSYGEFKFWGARGGELLYYLPCMIEGNRLRLYVVDKKSVDFQKVVSDLK